VHWRAHAGSALVTSMSLMLYAQPASTASAPTSIAALSPSAMVAPLASPPLDEDSAAGLRGADWGMADPAVPQPPTVRPRNNVVAALELLRKWDDAEAREAATLQMESNGLIALRLEFVRMRP